MASSSTSPITSVPEPGTSDISDSLAASIITQVSPTGTTAQPARPTKVARAPKAKRKKDAIEGEGATAVTGDDDDDDKEEPFASTGQEAASTEKLAVGESEKPSTTALSTADPTPTPSATVIQSAPPATTTPQPRSTPALQTKKNKRGPFASFFAACIPCLSPSDTFTDPPASTATKVLPTTNGVASPVLSEKTPTPALLDDLPIPVDPQDETDAGVVLSHEETEGVTSGAVMPPGKGRRRKSGRAPEGIITSVPEPGQRREESSEESENESEGSEEDEEQGLIARGGVGIPIGEDGLPCPLLDPLAPELKGRKCLVLDLDETLVHSSFKQMVHQADYVVPVEIENQYHNVYVIKRPGVDDFLKAMGEIYEVVIFTASLSKYADPVLDQLDIHRVVKHRLFRESCYNNKGNYVKDLSQLGRPMSECIIIDNSPASYVFHINNAVPISSWFNDPHDTELTDLIPFLTDLKRVDDIRSVLDAGLYQHWS